MQANKMADTDVIITIFTVAGVLVAVFTALYTMMNDRKNLKLHGLNLVFQKFNNPKTRNARGKILSAYSKYLQENDLKRDFSPSDFPEHVIIDLAEIYPKLKNDIIKVKSDFEEIAVMEKNGMIDEEAYFDAYWGMMLRCFAALHGNIINSRKKSGTQHYTVYFEAQCERVFWYWMRVAPQDRIKYYFEDKLKTNS